MSDPWRRLIPAPLRRAARSHLSRHIREGVDEATRQLQEQLSQALEQQMATRADLERVYQIVAANLDDIGSLRRELIRARESAEYASTFADSEPLVSVRIATYNRSGLLLERTIPSVLRQTHSKLELIIVGDGCSDDTAERVQQIPDPRIRFFNLPHRGVYPESRELRWLVAGIPAMNFGARTARGRWIAPLDDDDEFEPDHIRSLLATALEDRYEMVYGKLKMVPKPPDQSYTVGAYPPAHGQFGFQAALYMRALSAFEYEPRAWLLGEPGDWNLGRRMLEAGVRIGWLDQVVTNVYMTGPR